LPVPRRSTCSARSAPGGCCAGMYARGAAAGRPARAPRGPGGAPHPLMGPRGRLRCAARTRPQRARPGGGGRRERTQSRGDWIRTPRRRWHLQPRRRGGPTGGGTRAGTLGHTRGRPRRADARAPPARQDRIPVVRRAGAVGRRRLRGAAPAQPAPLPPRGARPLREARKQVSPVADEGRWQLSRVMRHLFLLDSRLVGAS